MPPNVSQTSSRNVLTMAYRRSNPALSSQPYPVPLRTRVPPQPSPHQPCTPRRQCRLIQRLPIADAVKKEQPVEELGDVKPEISVVPPITLSDMTVKREEEMCEVKQEAVQWEDSCGPIETPSLGAQLYSSRHLASSSVRPPMRSHGHFGKMARERLRYRLPADYESMMRHRKQQAAIQELLSRQRAMAARARQHWEKRRAQDVRAVERAQERRVDIVEKTLASEDGKTEKEEEVEQARREKEWQREWREKELAGIDALKRRALRFQRELEKKETRKRHEQLTEMLSTLDG